MLVDVIIVIWFDANTDANPADISRHPANVRFVDGVQERHT